MSKVKKISKRYYQISSRPICTVFLDEKLMRKANKILYKYNQELQELLTNNTEHLIKHEWSLAYPNKEQTTFYSAEPIDEYQPLVKPFTTKVVDNLFNISGRSVYSDDVKKEVEEYLEAQS